jgi:predicted Zn-dependent protease
MGDTENSDCRGNVRAIARREFLQGVMRLAAGALAIALILGGLYRGYALWRNRHLEKQATEFSARGDVASAVLAARQLLALQPRNIRVMSLMADLAERSGSAEALDWRKAVAAAGGKESSAQLALARTALHFNDMPLAERVLASLPAAFRETPEAHELAGALALSQGHTAAAEEHFAAALATDPSNDRVRLNLATVRLASRDPQVVRSAHQDLTTLSARTGLRQTALRALAADALAHRDFAAAQQFASALVAEAQPLFSDYLLHLEASKGAPDALALVKREAAKTSETAAQLIAWMDRHDRAADAFAWAQSLAPAVRETQPMPTALAESLSCKQDWQQLARFVRGKDWKTAEPLRMAIESHAVHHLANEPEAEAEADALWRNAIRAAQGNVNQLATIARLAEGWGYKPQAQAAWWTIANGTLGARDALLSLNRLYRATRDTRGLLRVAKRALELNPDDLVAANNAANLGLLLNGDAASHHLAAKLHDEHPGYTVLAATFAFSLHLQGKTADALRVLEQLKTQQLHEPALAAYYVMMLADSGKLARAREFLAIAERATLLPEEQQLLANAARKLAANS